MKMDEQNWAFMAIHMLMYGWISIILGDIFNFLPAFLGGIAWFAVAFFIVYRLDVKKNENTTTSL